MKTKVEEWRDIEGYPYYMVSSFGNIMSKGRLVKVNRTKRGDKTFLSEVKPIIIVPTLNRLGYLTVCLNTEGGDRKTVTIHRLVALAFLPNLNKKPQVNHIDGNKANNMVENLEWCTNQENQLHAYKMGLLLPRLGEKNSSSKVNEKQVIEIKQLIKENKHTSRQIAEQVGATMDIVNDIKRGKTWKHIKI